METIIKFSQKADSESVTGNGAQKAGSVSVIGNGAQKADTESVIVTDAQKAGSVSVQGKTKKVRNRSQCRKKIFFSALQSDSESDSESASAGLQAFQAKLTAESQAFQARLTAESLVCNSTVVPSDSKEKTEDGFTTVRKKERKSSAVDAKAGVTQAVAAKAGVTQAAAAAAAVDANAAAVAAKAAAAAKADAAAKAAAAANLLRIQRLANVSAVTATDFSTVVSAPAPASGSSEKESGAILSSKPTDRMRLVREVLLTFLIFGWGLMVRLFTVLRSVAVATVAAVTGSVAAGSVAAVAGSAATVLSTDPAAVSAPSGLANSLVQKSFDSASVLPLVESNDLELISTSKKSRIEINAECDTILMRMRPLIISLIIKNINTDGTTSRFPLPVVPSEFMEIDQARLVKNKKFILGVIAGLGASGISNCRLSFVTIDEQQLVDVLVTDIVRDLKPAEQVDGNIAETGSESKVTKKGRPKLVSTRLKPVKLTSAPTQAEIDKGFALSKETIDEGESPAAAFIVEGWDVIKVQEYLKTMLPLYGSYHTIHNNGTISFIIFQFNKNRSKDSKSKQSIKMNHTHGFKQSSNSDPARAVLLELNITPDTPTPTLAVASVSTSSVQSNQNGSGGSRGGGGGGGGRRR